MKKTRTEYNDGPTKGIKTFRCLQQYYFPHLAFCRLCFLFWDKGTAIKTSVLSYGTLDVKQRNLNAKKLSPLPRYYRLLFTSQQNYRESFPVHEVISVVTAVLPLIPLTCHSRLSSSYSGFVGVVGRRGVASAGCRLRRWPHEAGVHRVGAGDPATESGSERRSPGGPRRTMSWGPDTVDRERGGQTWAIGALFIRLTAAIRTTRLLNTGWHKKVSQYHESSLNRIKTRHYGSISHQFRLQNEHKNMISLH